MRQLIEYKGPFAANSTISVPAEYNTVYTHLGINYTKPRSNFIPIMEEKIKEPIIETTEDGEDIVLGTQHRYVPTDTYRELQRNADIRINNKDYILNQNGVLEFDVLGETSWEIRFLRSFPAETIVDIIIETI